MVEKGIKLPFGNVCISYLDICTIVKLISPINNSSDFKLGSVFETHL